ncbi:MAG: M6 family metalloprotease domain-containing protein [Bacteroidales bacterium]|nr:M6 family metalloprotease domain-containing protein [Bacteroidales bacterium]
MMRRGVIAAVMLLQALCLWGQPIIPRQGEIHIPVILVEFADVPMTLEEPLQHFQNLLNQPGYEEDGATGSVLDYFTENSEGLFRPVFDVLGPVKLDKKMAFYGKDVFKDGVRDDTAPEIALLEACSQLDEEVDFARYDLDQDGIVDLCIFFYAGYDQAAGGNSDAIWSHHWSIQDTSVEADREARFDEVKLGAYFCSAELDGSEGSRPNGIGSCCHELAHTLGLPDFYDVNGAEDGYAGGLYDFSLMCRGLYNNEGRTPPYMNAVERALLDWQTDIPELPEGDVVLGPVHHRQAYRIPTATEGEYFLVETRDGTGWDAPMPEGLLIYHIDRSERPVGEISALDLWKDWRLYNGVNNSGDHPCFYIIPSSSPASLNYGQAFNASSLVFPGTSRQLCYEPIDWEGEYTGIQLTCIENENGLSRFRVLRDAGSNVNGLVRNSAGKPVADVTVSLEGSPTSVLTGPDGFFLLPMEGEGSFVLNASKNGYLDASVQFSMKEGTRMSCVFVQLQTPGEAAHTVLEKYDPEKTPGVFNQSVAIGAVRFSAQELCDLAGRQLTQVVCYPYITSQDPEDLGAMYVTVDFGPVRVLNKKVENPTLGEFRRVVVDLAEENLRIPEGIDIYIGYGFEKAEGNYPLSVVYPGSRGNSYWSEFSLEESGWSALHSASLGQYLDLMLSADAGEVPAASLDKMGYVYIDPGTGNYHSGDTYTPSLLVPEYVHIHEVEWSWDGSVLKTGSFVLGRGVHLLEARLVYEDGRREKLQTKVKVN